MYPGYWSQRTPDKPAIICAEDGVALTYRELDERSAQTARVLRFAGLKTGDHIAIAMDNSAEFLVMAWAAQRIGLYYTPINWHLTTKEMLYVVADSGAKALVCDSTTAEFGSEVPGAGILRLSIDGDIEGFTSLIAARASQPTGRLEDETEGADMVYSSGTTGRPKGGIRRLTGVDPMVGDPRFISAFERFEVDAQTVYLSPGAPLYHAAPLRWCLGIHRLGGTLILCRRFNPLESLTAIETYQVTHSQWVPTMFVRLLELHRDRSRPVNLSSHRVAIHSAAPCPPSIKRQMLDWWGPILYEYYGASEGGLMAIIGPEEWLAHPGSVGRPFIGIPHILDEDGAELGSGHVGSIYVERGLKVNYHNDAAKTEGAHNSQGWSTIGDMGWLDEEGYLYLADRRDDLIIRGGVNIYPKEIEDVLISHPAVADVAVFGVPDPTYGHEIKAVLTLKGGTPPSESLVAELEAFCHANLARYKCPHSFDFEDELPRASSGKLYKQRLRDRYLTP